jgi:spore coat protein Y
VSKNNNCICSEMKVLFKEQKILSGSDREFQFICMSKEKDTIPFMLIHNKTKKPFLVNYKGTATPYFRLEKIVEEICCAVLSLLVAVDMDGSPVDSDDDFYALRKTNSCVIVDLNCFCVINPLAPELVNRPLPVIEPKK